MRKRKQEAEQKNKSESSEQVGGQKFSHDGDDDEYKGVIDALQRIYRSEGGIVGLYAGVFQAIGKAVTDSFVFFLAYTFLRQKRLKARGLKMHALLPVLDELSVGYLAESFAKLLTMPISTVLTRKQVEGLVEGNAKAKSSTKDIILRIVKEKGLQGLWSGYSATLFLALNPSITFFVNEILKFAILPRSKRRNPPALATFFFAAISKALATSVTYPFTLAKSRSQASASMEDSRDRVNGPNHPPSTILHVIHGIARSEGLSALYDGLSGDVIRGFMGHGITMMLKDLVRAFSIRCYHVSLKALRRYPSPEELIERARLQAEELADTAKEQVTLAGEKVADTGKDVAGKVVDGGQKAAASTVDNVATAAQNVRPINYMNETAELVGDYVEDEGQEWKRMYYWLWRKGKGDSNDSS